MWASGTVSGHRMGRQPSIRPLESCPSCCLYAGFPVRLLPYTLAGFDEAGGQGISGGDFDCPMSLLPGQCAFNSTFDAAVVCDGLPNCRSLMILHNGK